MFKKSTELRPMPTTSKGFSFGKGRLNRTPIFYKLLSFFSRFSEKEFRDRRKNSMLRRHSEEDYEILQPDILPLIGYQNIGYRFLPL